MFWKFGHVVKKKPFPDGVYQRLIDLSSTGLSFRNPTKSNLDELYVVLGRFESRVWVVKKKAFDEAFHVLSGKKYITKKFLIRLFGNKIQVRSAKDFYCPELREKGFKYLL